MSKTWLGVSLDDIYNGEGPWKFSSAPILPSKYHSVLYQIPINLKSVPHPFRASHPRHWDDEHVRMPFSPNNLFPVKEGGKDVIKQRWELICKAFKDPIKSSHDFEKAIHSYSSNNAAFDGFHGFCREFLTDEERTEFFEQILPKIIKLALQLPSLVPGSLPLLKKHHNKSVSLSQMQIACLLANAFLCTFPWRRDVAGTYPGVNFTRLYMAHLRPKYAESVYQKLKCIIHYFRRVLGQNPVGVVTFERKFINRGQIPRWDVLENNLGSTRVHISSSGTIEDDGLGLLQVDFANKNVGGGVLSYGCVQEEIRFVICPELIISRLFVEQLTDTEAIIVTGVERYSKYTGYGDTFQWGGNVVDATPFDEDGRRRTSIAIIDATHFLKSSDQFYPSAMLRELSKAYVGFHNKNIENLAPVATGNWGCGAFQGDARLKSLLQLMACNAAKRDMVYFTFGDEALMEDFYNMYLFIAQNKVTITMLWRILCKFASSHCKQEKLYSYIQQAYFDTKSQPSLRKLFGLSSKPKDAAPSTSSRKPEPLPKADVQKTDVQKVDVQKADVQTPDVPNINDEDPNVIESSQSELSFVSVSKTKVKSKYPDEEVKRKLDVSHKKLLDLFDEPMKTSSSSEEGDTFLNIVDKLRKKSRTAEDVTKCEEAMEVVENNEKSARNSAKKKITDYFLKTSKSS